MAESDPLKLLQPAATRVRDPVTGRSVWLAGMVREARIDGDTLRFDVAFQTGHNRVARAGIAEALEANLRGEGWTGPIDLVPRLEQGEQPAPAAPERPKDPVTGMSGGGMQPHGGPIQKKPLAGVRFVVAVASGKGGVGKSTVATNLAVGLRELGFAVGLLDADIYGPSLPTMMGVNSRPLAGPDKKILPVKAYGVACLSIGLLVPPDQAIIWRGPMIMGALRNFLQDTKWGELDYLIVDLPPGTGDTQLSLIQSVDIDGAVIVTTPQKVALDDAVRGIAMFNKLEVPILGLVENMAWYELPDGTRDPIFGEGGGVRTAQEHSTDVLAQIPLESRIRQSCDDGKPVVLAQSSASAAFRGLAAKVASKLPVAG